MKIAWLILLVPVFLFGQNDKLPVGSILSSTREIPFNPYKAKVGTFGCVFPIGATIEGHLWVDPTTFYYSKRCIKRAEKTERGWKIYLDGLKLIEKDKDQRFHDLNWIKIAEIVP